jgi:protein arginine N-methyltransferase 1
MFSLAEFGNMIGDAARAEAHAEALRRVVTPASAVLDLGAGTGIMSLLACRAGARRVYAVEPSGAVQLLVEAARANGFADRIVVLQARSTEVTLPEPVDVIVSDLRGVLPPRGSHFADVADARRRLLAPGGVLLPARDDLWAAVVAAPAAFAEARDVWESRPQGLDLRAALAYVEQTPQKHRARPEDLLSKPLRWASLDYPTLEGKAVRGAGTCVITRGDVAHGLLLWFEVTLVDGVGYSAGPGTDGIYGQMLFGWPRAVALEPGDRVSFDVRADPVGGDYVWTWETEIVRGPDGARSATRFRQSTFKSLLPGPGSLARRAADYAPTLSAEGEGLLDVLAGMRAGLAIGELARRLREARPERFASLDEAHGFVAAVVERYGA